MSDSGSESAAPPPPPPPSRAPSRGGLPPSRPAASRATTAATHATAGRSAADVVAPRQSISVAEAGSVVSVASLCLDTAAVRCCHCCRCHRCRYRRRRRRRHRRRRSAARVARAAALDTYGHGPGCMWLHAVIGAGAYTSMCMVTRARSGTAGMTGSTPPGAEAVPYDQGMVLYPRRQCDSRPPGARCECFPGGCVSSGRS